MRIEKMAGNFRQETNILDIDTEVGNRKERNKERKREDWPKERVEVGEPQGKGPWKTRKTLDYMIDVNSDDANKNQFSSVAQSCPTLCDPMDCSPPGLPVHHQLPEFTQTHVHWFSDAIQPSQPPAFNLSQHQGLLKWVSSSHQVAKVLEFQLQHQSFQSVLQDWFPLGWTGWTSLQSKGLSRVFSNTTVQKHQFFGTQLSSQSNSYIHTWPLEKP